MGFASLRLLRFLLSLYVVASMTYFVADIAAFYDRYAHSYRHVQDPFHIDYDSVRVDTVSKEAQAAGIEKGDLVESLDSQPYSGGAQWRSLERDAHPGDTLAVGIRDPQGKERQIRLRLHANSRRNLSTSQWVFFLGLELSATLICLLVGYWVAAAKIRELNAWLILVLLSFTEVLFNVPDWWDGGWLIFLGIWYQILQIAGPLVVFLIGVYFPERWRLDRKLPWLKWLLIVPPVLSLGLVLLAQYGEYFHPALGPLTLRIGPWVDGIVNPINLICVLLYWVAIFDKLRSASTADARRRLRVLFAGSVIGLGSLLVIFILLPRFGVHSNEYVWLAASGAFLCLAFPFSLAYVVVVQRAMDVSILVRMGTRYVLARATLTAVQIILLAVVAQQTLGPLFSKKQVHASEFVLPLLLCAVIFGLAFFGLGPRLQRWLDRRFFREAYTSELVLSELSEQARTLTEAKPLISTISKRISEVLHVPQIGVLLRGGQSFQLQEAVGLQTGMPLILSEDSAAVRNLIRENRPATLYRENPDSWFAQAGDEEKRTLNAVNAEVLLPLRGRERLMGLMTLGPKRSEEPYSPTDLRLLQSVATQTGLSLEISELVQSLAQEEAQRERMNREIEIAREVQQRLFPQSTPQLPGISLAGACRPALGVGGDYYDFIELEDGRLGLAIGDVSGKGISAALLMASLRASLRGMTLEGSNDLSKLMRNVNQLVFEASTSNRYATFFFSVFNPRTRELRYVNAGHNPPVLLRGQAEAAQAILLETGGPVVGLLRSMVYQEDAVTLESGDLLLCYTDGISEAMTADDEEWGEERMVAAAHLVKLRPAADIVADLFEAADGFTEGAPQHDDMTLLVMRVG